jgi:hypothetical protein
VRNIAVVRNPRNDDAGFDQADVAGLAIGQIPDSTIASRRESVAAKALVRFADATRMEAIVSPVALPRKSGRSAAILGCRIAR